jgi:predicted NBD/HSP70 family sugar kinase
MSAAEDIRGRNTRACIEALHRHGSLSRTALRQVTGLSRATVASILDELEHRGLIVAQDGADAPRSRGRPPELLRLHPRTGVALGISLERENLQVALVDLSLTVLARRSLEFEVDPPVDRLIEIAAELAEDALADETTGRGELIGVGVGVPRPVDPTTGGVQTWLRSDGKGLTPDRWGGHDIEAAVAGRLGVPVTIDNDANVAGLAEATTGAGRDRNLVIYIRASWGIGGAILRNGQVYRGRAGYVGELAHIITREDGRLCPCGRRGCLGEYASGFVLRELMEPALGAQPSLRDIVDLAAAGDIGARRALTDAGREIGTAIAGTCLALNPDAVIVGGELGGPRSPLLDGIHDALERRVLPHCARAATVVPSRLGAGAGALGAAGLVVRSPLAAAHLASHV